MMTNKILNNPKEISIKKEGTDICFVEVYKTYEINKDINFSDNSNGIGLFVVFDSSVELDIKVNIGSNIDIFVIFIGEKDKKSKGYINGVINGSGSNLNINILNFVLNESDLDVVGKIEITKNIKNSTGNLIEENIVLGDTFKLKNKPLLNINSNNVAASHAAKIDFINGDKTFYMTSRGINEHDAQKIILYSYINNIVDKFEGKMIESELESLKNMLIDKLL